jgi:transposase
MDLALLFVFNYVSNRPLRLELSSAQKKELFSFMKSTCDKEEYRRAYAIKQKLEGLPYRTIAKDIGVNYRNVYDWINNYRKFGLEDGIRNRRKNGGRKPMISTEKNKETIKDI